MQDSNSTSMWPCIHMYMCVYSYWSCPWLPESCNHTHDFVFCNLLYNKFVSNWIENQCLSPNDFGYTNCICYPNTFEVYFEPHQCCRHLCTLSSHSGVSVRRASGQDSCSEEPGRLAAPQLWKWRAGSAARHGCRFVAGYHRGERLFAYQINRFN